MAATETDTTVCTGHETSDIVVASCPVFQSLADGIVVHGLDDHAILEINPVLAAWIDDEDPGGDFFELFTHDVRADMRTAFASRIGSLPGDYRLGLGRRVRWVELSTARANFRSGEAWVTTLRDVTDRRRALERADVEKDRADRAEARRRDTMAALSNELRNPISGVLGLSQSLLQSGIAEEQREVVESIHATTGELMTLLDELHDLTRVERGKFQIEESPFSPHSVCRNCIDTAPDMEGAELRLEIDEAVPPACVGDADRIGQILSSLLAQAIKLTHRGHVTLRVDVVDLRAERVSLRFVVEDSGIGFDEELLPRIFEPFAQMQGSSSPAYGGTGLGLSLSQQLVRLMGSEIEVESAAGRGTRFEFVLVLGRGPDGAVDRSERGNVLYVGAAGPRRKAFVDAIRASGESIETCESSAVALDRIRTRRAEGTPYAEVFVEKQLPDVDGETFARSVRHRLRIADLRLTLVASEDTAIDDERAARSGIDRIARSPEDTTSAAPQPTTGALAQTAHPSSSTEEKEQMSRAEEQDVLATPRVLVVEDNPVNQKVVCHMLRKMGFTVELAADGEAGVARLADDGPFDIVLMDCQMPVMDGYQATRTIRGLDDDGAATPIVALTANAMDGDREKCLASGMDDYLSKPAKADQLREMLTKWIPACEERIARGKPA